MSQQIETLNAYLYQQKTILDSLPISILIKDNELNYRYFNAAALCTAGFKQCQDIYEHSDYEMPWYDQADIFQNGGKKVLSGMHLLTLDPITNNNGQEMTYLTQQTPIRDNGNNIIGISLITKVIAKHKLLKRGRYVTADDKTRFAEFIIPHLPETPIYRFNLSNNAKTTLYYLLRGATTEQIAQRLCRSHYTIKDRVEQLKQIFACNTKSELINKAIREGYMSLMPEHIKA